MILDNIDFHEFIESIIEILEARDTYTRGHSVRVAHYSYALAKKMGLPKGVTNQVHIAGHLHDIGKIGISDNIIYKMGRLNSEEYEIIKTHSEIGYNILNKVKSLKNIAVIVKHHHERWDGAGYPTGISGKDIPLESRIINIADAYDAMISNRIYRDNLSKALAIREIRNNMGKQFDPIIARLFIDLIQSGFDIDKEIKKSSY